MSYFKHKNKLSIQYYYLKRAKYYLLKGDMAMYYWHLKHAQLH